MASFPLTTGQLLYLLPILGCGAWVQLVYPHTLRGNAPGGTDSARGTALTPYGRLCLVSRPALCATACYKLCRVSPFWLLQRACPSSSLENVESCCCKGRRGERRRPHMITTSGTQHFLSAGPEFDN